MKKKILALVLCLVLCLPLVLTSCGNFSDAISSTQREEKTSYKALEENSYKGGFNIGLNGDQNGRFFYTTDDVQNKDGTVTVTHRVYDAISGNELYKKNVTDHKVIVSVILSKKDLFAVGEGKDYGSLTYTIYNEESDVMAEDIIERPRFIYNLDDDAVIYDHALYFYKENKLELVKDLKETKVEDIIHALTPAGEGYVLVSKGEYYDVNGEYAPDDSNGPDGFKSDAKIFVFNSDFEQVAVQTLTPNSLDYYTTEKTNWRMLDNGNVLVQVISTIGNYLDAFEVEYDFVWDGVCYALDTYLYNVNKQTYKELRFDYIIDDEITTATENLEKEGCGLYRNADNMAYAFKIEDGKILYSGINSLATPILISNSGKVQEVEIPDGGYKFISVTDTRYIIEGDYFVRLYDETGAVVGEIGDLEDYNKNFIASDWGIYSITDFKKIVDLTDTADTDFSLEGATIDSVIYSEWDYDNNKATYYIVKPNGEIEELFDEDLDCEENGGTDIDLVVSDDRCFFAIEQEKYAKPENENERAELKSMTYAFYTTDGEEIASFTQSYDKAELYVDLYEGCYYWEDYAIFVKEVEPADGGDIKYSFLVVSR